MTRGCEVIGEYPGVHRIWHCPQLTFTCWVGKPTAAAVRAISPISELMVGRYHGAKLANVQLVLSQLELPDAEARNAFVDLAHNYGPYNSCVGIVVPGSGFWASAIRSFVTGIRMITPRSLPLNTHASTAELLEWLPKEHEARTGAHVDTAELRRAIEEIEAWAARNTTARSSIYPAG